MSHVAWDGAAPNARRLPVPILTLHRSLNVIVQLLDTHLGVWLHYLPRSTAWPKGRSKPHKEPRCEWCDQGLPPPRWQAYAPARQYLQHRPEEQRWELCVVPLSAETVHAVIADRQPRGLILQVTYNRVEILERQVKAELPESFDVRPYLLRVWGEPSANWNQRVAHHPACLPFRGEKNGKAKKPRRKKGGA